jgi:hypothetical protein
MKTDLDLLVLQEIKPYSGHHPDKVRKFGWFCQLNVVPEEGIFMQTFSPSFCTSRISLVQ